MKFNDKISIIVPAYNVERYVNDCLESIATQTYSNLEVIVVNDGSTDSTRTIIENFISNDNRFTLKSIDNSGLSAARNTGISLATGDWYLFVDSDDLLPANAIETLVDVIDYHQNKNKIILDVVCGSFDRFVDEPTKTNRPSVSHLISGKDATLNILYQTESTLNTSAWGKLFNAKLWQNVSFPIGKLYEDLETIPQIIKDVDIVATTEAIVYHYRITEGSILSTMTPKRFDVLDATQNLIDSFTFDKELKRAAEDRQLSAAFNMLMLMGKSGFNEEKATERCAEIIRKYRYSSLIDNKVRLKNKAGILLSYLIGIRPFKSKFIGNLFLSR